MPVASLLVRFGSSAAIFYLFLFFICIFSCSLLKLCKDRMVIMSICVDTYTAILYSFIRVQLHKGR